MNAWNRLRVRHLYRRLNLYLWRRPKLIICAALFTIGFLYLFYQLFILSPLSNSHDDDHLVDLLAASGADKCSAMSEGTAAAFQLFVKRIITTFDSLKVTNFICYETLWTALRHKASAKGKTIRKLRLTDGCFNLCVINEDLMAHDDALIERRFRNNGISLKYAHGDGLYILKPNTQIFSQQAKDDDPALHPELFTIHARIHVFEHDDRQDMYRKVGWKRRMLPSTMCQQLHCFPPTLIAGTLPQYELAPDQSLNMPREGIEIQKYHYPETWWTMANSHDECDKN